jgi:hypothetical protein
MAQSCRAEIAGLDAKRRDFVPKHPAENKSSKCSRKAERGVTRVQHFGDLRFLPIGLRALNFLM